MPKHKIHILKQWLQTNPFPSKEEKIKYSHFVDLPLAEISTWFAKNRYELKRRFKPSIKN